MNPIRVSLLLLLPICLIACDSTTPRSTTEPIVSAQSDQLKFENQTDGISFMYPAAWKVNSADATNFKFVQKGKGDPLEMTLDVPKLPWHPPGWIPIDSVRDGYVDDVKKRMKSAQVTKLPDSAVPDAKQHRMMLAGQIDNKAVVDDAVMLVHNDRVYILSIETDPADYPWLKKALEDAVATIRWTK